MEHAQDINVPVWFGQMGDSIVPEDPNANAPVGGMLVAVAQLRRLGQQLHLSVSRIIISIATARTISSFELSSGWPAR